MVNCPIKDCGRKFENDETMLEHVRRRHPNQYAGVRLSATKSLIEKEHVQQQQLNKLPKLAKIFCNESNPLDKPREARNSSKTRKLESANLSSIIQESRMTTGAIAANKSSIASRRPSLTKKNSSSDLKSEKLPPLQKESNHSREFPVEAISKQQAIEQGYSTLPNFKSLALTINRSGSKERKGLIKQKELAKSQSLTLRDTMTAVTSTRLGQEPARAQLRPTKKGDKKGAEKALKKASSTDEAKTINLQQRIVTIINWGETIFNCPGTSKIEVLYINNCRLSTINLNSLESLIELSANHNQLKDMEFLRYSKNHNIKVLHLDHNQITSVYTPPKAKILTGSFNLIQAGSLEEVCAALKKSPQLEQVDFSFNSIRKASNYKLKILAMCPRMRKIDGLTVTKIDIEMMEELLILESKQKGLIPLGSLWSERPTTASEVEWEPTDCLGSKSIDQLERQQKEYERLISQTEHQLKVIRQENEIINSELEQLIGANKKLSPAWESESLLKKLHKECEFLQLLNIMQHADEEELRTMVMRKKEQLEMG